MATYLFGGKCLKGVEYYGQDEDQSSFSFSSSGGSSLSDSFNQIVYPEQESAIFLRRQGLSSQDLSLRLSKIIRSGQESSCLELDASRNQMTFIPTHLEFFTHLTQLVLSNNLLSVIPPELYQNLVQLQVLVLSENQIESIPQDMPHYLPDLTSFSLDGNNISVLPDSIGYWRKLREFRLGSSYGGNHLKTLPDTIANMTGLVDLDVSFNQLQSLLPNTFLNLPLLSCINLSHNQMDQLPVLFGCCPKLTTVDLSDNQITSLSQIMTNDFQRLEKLELLNLSNNQLCILPTELLDRSGTQVIIKGNPIIEFPVLQGAYHQFVRDMTQRAEPTRDYSIENSYQTSTTSHHRKDINQVMTHHAIQHHLVGSEDNTATSSLLTGVAVIEESIPPMTGDKISMEPMDMYDTPFLLHSLREISLRAVIILSSNNQLLSQIPDHIAVDLRNESVQLCPSCHGPYIREWISSVQLKSYRGHPSVVRKVRFCGTKCWHDYRAKLAQKIIDVQNSSALQRQEALRFIRQRQDTLESGSINWIMAAVSAASAQEEQADLLANTNT
ncbi:hypothetical protein HPULCUR_001539 [Helicostylum pulchrum]|uniref:Uncharacterized protein n=1 Tax=Helicostylum pulchrum TaxID=562976 RepID=A0ABP9XMZ7_9FUNG